MADSKLKSFFKKAGEDMKRMGAEVKDEAQKLMNDKQKQSEWKDNLLGAAKSAADGLGKAFADPLKTAEKAVKKFTGPTPGMNPELYEMSKTDRDMTERGPGKYAHLVENDSPSKTAETDAPPDADATPPNPPEPTAKAPPPAKKTIGRSTGKRPATTAPKKKTIGKPKAKDTLDE